MQFLKTLMWVLVLVAGIIFAINNWQPVTVSLWSGLVLDTSLPFLMFVSFLVGFLPMLLWHRASRWRITRKLDTAERALAEHKAAATPPAAPADPIASIPPAAAPIAVPPGVS